MELYIGGLCQGKLEYVRNKYNLKIDDERICDGRVCSKEDILNKKVINHYHEFIKCLLTEGEDPITFTKELILNNPDAIIISNEVGYGVVPMEKENRIFREVVGHSHILLAKHCSRVERIICGLGVIIKEREN